MTTEVEAEIKLACDDLNRLREAGFDLQMVETRHFEDNWLLDSANHMLLNQGAALRIRMANGRGWVTYKGVVHQSNSPVKVREEIEIETDHPDRMFELFERLGFERSFRYQKYRTVYRLTVDNQELNVVLDETPIGTFIEVEGEEGRVAKVFEAAHFSVDDIIRESYPELQASRCRKRGTAVEDLVFK